MIKLIKKPSYPVVPILPSKEIGTEERYRPYDNEGILFDLVEAAKLNLKEDDTRKINIAVETEDDYYGDSHSEHLMFTTKKTIPNPNFYTQLEAFKSKMCAYNVKKLVYAEKLRLWKYQEKDRKEAEIEKLNKKLEKLGVNVVR